MGTMRSHRSGRVPSASYLIIVGLADRVIERCTGPAFTGSCCGSPSLHHTERPSEAADLLLLDSAEFMATLISRLSGSFQEKSRD